LQCAGAQAFAGIEQGENMAEKVLREKGYKGSSVVKDGKLVGILKY